MHPRPGVAAALRLILRFDLRLQNARVSVTQTAEQAQDELELLLISLHRRNSRGEFLADCGPIDLLQLQKFAGLLFEFTQEEFDILRVSRGPLRAGTQDGQETKTGDEGGAPHVAMMSGFCETRPNLLSLRQ